MMYEIQVDYSETVVRRAALHFLTRFIRREAVIGFVLAFVAIGAWLGFGIDWRLAAVFASIGLGLAALVIFVGLAYVRSAIGKFRLMKIPTVTWRFEDDCLAARSDLGSVEIKWQAVSAVWRFPGVWLLFFGTRGWGYSTLSTAALGSEVLEYVLARIRANGGKAY
jgi:hypothetical protein